MLSEKQDLTDTIRKYELQKEKMRMSNQQLENYFTEQLEKIRSNFDLQLRDLVEKQKTEIFMLENDIEEKKFRIEEKISENIVLKKRLENLSKFNQLT